MISAWKLLARRKLRSDSALPLKNAQGNLPGILNPCFQTQHTHPGAHTLLKTTNVTRYFQTTLNPQPRPLQILIAICNSSMTYVTNVHETRLVSHLRFEGCVWNGIFKYSWFLVFGRFNVKIENLNSEINFPMPLWVAMEWNRTWRNE